MIKCGRRGEFTHFFLGSFRDGLRRGFFEKISLAQLEPCAKFGARFQLCRCEAPLFLVVSRINAKSLILGEKTRKTTLFVTRDFPSPSKCVISFVEELAHQPASFLTEKIRNFDRRPHTPVKYNYYEALVCLTAHLTETRKTRMKNRG